LSYHNVKVTYRLTGKEHLMFGRLQVLHRRKTASDLIRLAMAVLYELSYEDMPEQDRDGYFSTHQAGELVDALKRKCRTIPPAEVGHAKPGSTLSDKKPAKSKAKSIASK